MPATLFSRLNCYLTGHDYAVRSNGETMFLHCNTCGHRSSGWSLAAEHGRQAQHPQVVARANAAGKAAQSSRRATA